jgi:orotidine-5'-phosphate decarboxylase
MSNDRTTDSGDGDELDLSEAAFRAAKGDRNRNGDETAAGDGTFGLDADPKEMKDMTELTELTELTEAPPELRDRLVLALDVDDVVEAIRLVHELKPWFGVAKVGLELFTAAGPDAVLSVLAEGMKVFLDLKLFDIPTTVEKAGRVIGALGASYLTLAGFGGVPMLRAGVEGLTEGANRAGLDAPTALAVTMLTSDSDAPEHILGKRVAAALEAGCGGVVCAASDAAEVKRLAPRFVVVVPGIRTEGSPRHDHGRSATPGEAYAAGADLLVVGRTVTAAPDRAAAASQLIGSIVS